MAAPTASQRLLLLLLLFFLSPPWLELSRLLEVMEVFAWLLLEDHSRFTAWLESIGLQRLIVIVILNLAGLS